jgi:hypothetical protein
MSRFLIAATAVAALAVAVAASVSAGNVKNYEGASWYGKYLAVTAPTTPLCEGNAGAVQQLSFPGSPVNVDASHECGSQSETAIAIDPADPSKVLAGSNEIQRLPMRGLYSTDGGATFTGVDLPLPPPRTKNGFDFGSDPGVAFDSHGVAYYSYIVVFFGAGGGINGTEMAVARSTDGGATWTATFFNAQTGEGQFNDKPMITVDTTNGTHSHRNRVYVAWDNATGNSSSAKNGNNVLLSYSDDGVTFSTPVSVSGNFTGKTGGIGADPYVEPDGTLHVAWQDYAHGQISDVSSTDGGQTFSAPHEVASVAGFEFDPVAQSSRGALVYPACGALTSGIYCSYMDDTDGGTKVFVKKSTDHGVTWSSTAALPGGGDQFNQWLAVDPSDGSVNVAYYDTGVKDAPTTVYTLARSEDGGATWAKEAVATAPTDETGGTGVDLGNQYGDYEGIAALGGTVRPVWTDRRADIIALGLREEILTASLTFP